MVIFINNESRPDKASHRAESQEFNAASWRIQCQSIHADCQGLALSSLHFSLLLNQQMEDALRALPLDSVLEAIHIARQYDYETSHEIAELVQWVRDHSQCRHGVAWSQCLTACNKTCASNRLRAA